MNPNAARTAYARIPPRIQTPGNPPHRPRLPRCHHRGFPARRHLGNHRTGKLRPHHAGSFTAGRIHRKLRNLRLRRHRAIRSTPSPPPQPASRSPNSSGSAAAIERRPRAQSRRLPAPRRRIRRSSCSISAKSPAHPPTASPYRIGIDSAAPSKTRPTILALVEKEPLAKSCASLMLEMKRNKTTWTGAPGFELLREVELEAASLASPCAHSRRKFKAKSLG
jgi:hypothetical protein